MRVIAPVDILLPLKACFAPVYMLEPSYGCYGPCMHTVSKIQLDHLRGTYGVQALFLITPRTVLSLLNPAVNTCSGLEAICCSWSLLNLWPIPKEKISTPFRFNLSAEPITLSCEIPSVKITRTGFLPFDLPRGNKYLDGTKTKELSAYIF